jgi:hypothetical protein
VELKVLQRIFRILAEPGGEFDYSNSHVIQFPPRVVLASIGINMRVLSFHISQDVYETELQLGYLGSDTTEMLTYRGS